MLRHAYRSPTSQNRLGKYLKAFNLSDIANKKNSSEELEFLKKNINKFGV